MSREPAESQNSLDRRAFLKAGLIGGTAGASSELSAGEGQSPSDATGTVEQFELAEATIEDLHAFIAESSILKLYQEYQSRIEKIDQGGPRLNSVIQLNPEAEDEAKELDKERKEKGPRGPLHGIPILLKDNIDTKDVMRTTAGSLALFDALPATNNAVLVQRLKDAGALILGKTNLSEWAGMRSTWSVGGWSGVGGFTKNPYALDRNPSGSSSGSAVAVAANLCAAAVGTETSSSIVGPASVNGVVGIKPTLGLISRRGIVPLALSQDSAGPIARTVKDAAMLLDAMVGEDRKDTRQIFIRPKHADRTRYAGNLNKNGLKGKKIGLVRAFCGFHEDVDDLLTKAKAVMEAKAVRKSSIWTTRCLLILIPRHSGPGMSTPFSCTNSRWIFRLTLRAGNGPKTGKRSRHSKT